MISLTFLWKNGTNIANGKFKFGELRKSVFKEVLYEENRMYNAMYYAFICFECLWWRCQ